MAPGISSVELSEIRRWVLLSEDKSLEGLIPEECKLARRLQRIRRLVESRLETLRRIISLVVIIHEVPKSRRCAESLTELDYSLRATLALSKRARQ